MGTEVKECQEGEVEERSVVRLSLQEVEAPILYLIQILNFLQLIPYR